MESVTKQDPVKLAETQVTKWRWALGFRGVASLVLGLVILAWPGISLLALTIVVGVYAIVIGTFELGAAFSSQVKKERGWLIVSGLLGIAVGVAILVWPQISALALLYVIGAYAIALGILVVVAAFRLPLDGRDTALTALTGLVSIMFGIVMFARPGAGALVLLSLIAAFALVTGVSELVVAIAGKQLLERKAKKAFAPTTKATPQPSH
jgi:uncharacterized membrane protein HdeD (DUF308 family)